MKIISGGQSGVDRAALDFALRHRISCGGWCPQGRMAADGMLPKHYPLEETDFEDPEARTRKNVDESDATLFIFLDKMDEGTRFTLQYAKKQLKADDLIREEDEINKNEFKMWIEINKVKILNIAGPKESKSRGVYGFALHVLGKLFK